MNESSSPFTSLVVFMVCLSAAGGIVAGLHYIAIDLPVQEESLQAPSNAGLFAGSCLSDCVGPCQARYDECMQSPKGRMESNPCGSTLLSCTNNCAATCACSDCRDSCDLEYSGCLLQAGYTPGDCSGIRDTCYASCPC